jgi:hypothetical protein|tara:strand:+ start:1525 stop:1842 length:318 start_codon:yes stop_codon:yes gene_type:complete
MSKIKKFILLTHILLLASCNTVNNALTNPKKNSTDEFLVEKKSPLVMPPDYNELPIPNENNEQKDKNDSEFKTLISKKVQDAEADNNQDNNKNIEELILDKIKKN